MKIYIKQNEKEQKYIYRVDYCCFLSSVHFSGLCSNLKLHGIDSDFKDKDFIFKNFIIKYCPFCGTACEAEEDE